MAFIPNKPMLLALSLATALSSMGPAMAQTPGRDGEGCGWYIVLGCARNSDAAFDQLAELGGHGVGGGAGTHVLDTRFIENFNPSYFCVADGPYISRSEAGAVAWSEAVRDAYVKRGC